MNFSTMLRSLRVVPLIFSLATAPVHAGLDESLSSMLGANVQVNNGGPISSSTRNGFYGGSVYVRGKVMDVNVLNFTPPSFSSGCGGIDMFGGSFSMINKEQFVALLRSIAQNAAGYAFQLALKNICEQCATIMSNLQKVVQAMNDFTGNSCQLAQGVVNSSIAALEMSDVKGMQGTTIEEGFKDTFGAYWEDLSSSIAALNTTSPDGSNTYEDKFEVNIVWSAMNEAGMGGWFAAGGDTQLLEALMSLTGTIVLSGPADDESSNVSRNITPAVSGSYLTVRDIIYGNDGARSLNCTDVSKCLSMTSVERPVTGLHELLVKRYIGTGPFDPDSLIYQIANGTGGAEQTEEIIAELGQIGSLILSIARLSPKGSTAAHTLFEQNAEYIAYELAGKFISESVAGIEQAIKSKKYDTSHAEEWRKTDFKTALIKINSDMATVAENITSPMDSIGTYIDLYEHMILVYSPFGG